MKVIGIVGGVASGKSTVAREFGRLGAAALSADEAAHRALDDPGVKAALVDRWGEGVLLPDGRIDRAAVSRRVFGTEGARAPDGEREFLEGLVHPIVRRDLERQLEALAESGTSVVVLDVPLLVEVGWESMCDVVYYVEVPEAVRIERAKARGWSEDELRRREAAQAPLDQKRRSASSILENSGDLEHLRGQVAAAYQELMRTSV
jgi:dephospho-CoA kinase